LGLLAFDLHLAKAFNFDSLSEGPSTSQAASGDYSSQSGGAQREQPALLNSDIEGLVDAIEDARDLTKLILAMEKLGLAVNAGREILDLEKN
jgi:hypothetical protein